MFYRVRNIIRIAIVSITIAKSNTEISVGNSLRIKFKALTELWEIPTQHLKLMLAADFFAQNINQSMSSALTETMNLS